MGLRSPGQPRARRLKVIAEWINANVPALRARIERGYCNTDRKVGRLIWPGKGRTGNRIIVVRVADGTKALDHNAAETYRTNDEVEAWLADFIAGRRK